MTFNGSLVYWGSTFTNLTPGHSYPLVAHYWTCPERCRGWSSQVDTVWTDPNAPAGATLTVNSPTSITAAWASNGNSSQVSYRAVLKRVSDGATVAESPALPNTLSYRFTGLTANTSYRLSVAAVNARGVTAWLNAAAAATTPPAPPQNLAAAGVAQTSIGLSWQSGGNPAGTTYKVYRDGTHIGDTTATTYTDSGLSPGISYTYHVIAAGSVGTAASTTVTYRTIPPDVSGLIGANGGLAWSQTEGRGWVTLTWQAATGATGYLLDVFDGAAYRTFDLGNVTSWDSRTARIYPAEAYLDGFADNTLTADPWNRVQGGLDLRDSPVKLYRKTPGATYDATDNYFFHVRPYNESGDAGWKWGQSSHWYTPTLPVRTDAVAPALTLSINGGAVQAPSNTVQLAVAFADSMSGVAAVRFSNDGLTWSTWQAVDAPPGEGSLTLSRWALLAGPGSRTAYAQARDQAGNVSDPATASIWVAYETTSPTVQIGINGGAEVTTSTEVTLAINATSALTAPGDLQMQISNDGVAFSAWEPYVSQRTWILSPGDGLKTVTVRVRNQAGNIGQALDQIRLATGAATSTQPSGTEPVASVIGPSATVSVNGQPTTVTLVNHRRVTLRLNAARPATGLTISLDGVTYSPVEPLVQTKTLVLPGGDGPKTVYVRFVDDVGTKTAVYPVEVMLDTTPPEVQARWLGDASVTTADTADVILTASDALSGLDGMSVSFDRGATWQPFRDTMAVLVPRAGHNVVAVWVRDQAGNVRQLPLEIYRSAPR